MQNIRFQSHFVFGFPFHRLRNSARASTGQLKGAEFCGDFIDLSGIS